MENDRKILIGKTCGSLRAVDDFLDAAMQRRVARTYWVSRYKVFNEETKSDWNRYLVTCWVYGGKEEGSVSVELHKAVNGIMVLHRKPQGAIYTLNALNKLTELHAAREDVNWDENKNIIIPWDEYKNKFVCISKGELKLHDLELLHKVISNNS